MCRKSLSACYKQCHPHPWKKTAASVSIHRWTIHISTNKTPRKDFLLQLRVYFPTYFPRPCQISSVQSIYVSISDSPPQSLGVWPRLGGCVLLVAFLGLRFGRLDRLLSRRDQFIDKGKGISRCTLSDVVNVHDNKGLPVVHDCSSRTRHKMN